ncbi:hypothetical protein D7L51_12900 [Enterococcus faecalis]|nr:hypothetical protein [Enterococcus faecalis]
MHADVKKIMSVLQILIVNQGSEITSEQLSKLTGISVFTIREIIKRLIVKITEYGIEAKLTFVRQRGVILEDCNQEQYCRIKHISLTESINYELIENFLLQRYQTADKFCEEKHISVSSFRRKIKKLLPIFENYGLSIHGNSLKGEELVIRSFFAQYFNEVYEGYEWPFNKNDNHRHLLIIERLERETGIYLKKESKRELCFLWGISKIRREKQKYLEKRTNEFYKFSQQNQCFSKFIKIVEELIPKNEFFFNEIEYLFYSFYSMHFDYHLISQGKIEEKNSELQLNGCFSSNLTNKIVEILMNYFESKNLVVEYDSLSMEIRSICQHAQLFQKKLNFVEELSIGETLLDSYKNHPIFFKINEICDLNFKRNKSMSFDFQSVLEYVLMVVHTYQNLINFDKKIYISVCSKLGSFYEQIIVSYISQKFLTEYNIEFVRTTDKPDLIITDILGQDSFDRYILYLYQPIFDSHSYIELTKLLVKIINEK